MEPVLIIGGGIIGSSIACQLKWLEPEVPVTVIEPDPTYERASTPLSFGVFRVQFSQEQNIRMSLAGHRYLREFQDKLAIDGQAPPLDFIPSGYIFLYNQASVRLARRILEMQLSLGCNVRWLEPDQIPALAPGIEVSGLAGGIYSPQDGYLDPYAFLMAHRAKAIDLGVEFLKDRVVDFKVGPKAARRRVTGLKLASGACLTGRVAMAAGGWSMDLLKALGLTMPVRPIMRQVFAFKPDPPPTAPLPFIISPSGLYLRSETGDLVLIGYNMGQDPVITPQPQDFSWDRRRFEETVWPQLADLFPAFDHGRLMRGWAGLFDNNDLDANPLLGLWPGWRNLYVAFGFSGHGLMHSPPVGRYLAELILGLEHELDLSVFSPERIKKNQPVQDLGVF